MTEPLTDTLKALCDEYALTALYVFGSRAAEVADRVAGKAELAERPGSDVDIGVSPSRAGHLSARSRVRLSQQLETLLGVDRVDLVVLPEAEAFLAADAVRGELLAAADLAPFLREQWHDMVGSEL